MRFSDYIKFDRKLRKNDQTRKILLVVPFFLIIMLFIFNSVMSQKEQTYREEQYNLREKDANSWQESLNTGEWDSTPKIKKGIFEASENELCTISMFRSNNYLGLLKIENQEFKHFHEIELVSNIETSDPITEYGFLPSEYIKGKELLNNNLIEQNITPDSIRYGTNTATFLVSMSLYVTSVIGIVYFIFLFSFQKLKNREMKKYRLFATQPLSRKVIFVVDYLEFMTRSLLYYVILLIFGALLASIFGKVRQLTYPLVTYADTLDCFELIQVSRYLVIVSGLFLLNVSLSYLIVQCLFSFIKKSFTSVFVGVFLLMLISVMSAQAVPQPLKEITAWQPLLYYSPSKVVIGNSYVPIDEINRSYGISGNENDSFISYTSIFYPENIDYYSGNNLLKTTNNRKIHYTKGIISLIILNACLFLGNLLVFMKRMCS